MAGVLCTSALQLSDKTMTQYDEKQHWLSVIVPTEKDDTVVNSHAWCACECGRGCMCVLQGLPQEQMALSNTST